MADQVWATVNAHRRYFLAANGGKAFSFGFLPSTLVAYLQPFGIRFTFPVPVHLHPHSSGRGHRSRVGPDLSHGQRSAHHAACLFLLACWGTITAFRPRALVPFRLTRIVLITGAAGTAGVLLWGYISERYLADFMPFLIVASGIGLIEMWRRFEGRSIEGQRGRSGRRLRRCRLLRGRQHGHCGGTLGAVHAVAGPELRLHRGVPQRRLRSPTACSMGATLPDWAPYGQLFMVGNCSGLYLSSGITEADVPGLLIDHYTWIPVEQDPAFTRKISFTFNHPAKYFTKPVTLMTYGASSLVLEPAGTGYFRVDVVHSGTPINWPYTDSARKPISVLHEPFQIEVTTDPNLHQIQVIWYGTYFVTHFIAGSGPPVVHATPNEPRWTTSRGHRGRAAGLLQHEPVPKPAARELTERVATSWSAVGAGTVRGDRFAGPSDRPPSRSLTGQRQSTRARRTFSCVVDEHPRFHLDALRWFASLTTIAGVDPRDLVVHVVGPDTSDALLYLRSRGVTVRSGRGVRPQIPPLQQGGRRPRDWPEEEPEGPGGSLRHRCRRARGSADPRPPARVDRGEGGRHARPASRSAPRDLRGRRGAGAADHAAALGREPGNGRREQQRWAVPDPGALLPVLAPAWETWARWLLDRRELLLDWTFHLDQVAMVLALTAEGIGSEQLDVRWNTPIHDLTRIPPDPPIPAVIHYHQEVDPQGRIRLTGFPSIDRQIERVNEAIGQLWQEAFPNATFWQWRYLTDPRAGSGIGSRGQPLLGKRDLLASVLDAVAPASVLDVGCGDGEATQRPADAGLRRDRPVSRSGSPGRDRPTRRQVPRWPPGRLPGPSRSHHLSRHADP